MSNNSAFQTLRANIKRFFSLFLQGLLYIVPLVVIAWVVYGLFEWTQEQVNRYLPTVDWLSLLILIAFITGIGYAGTSILFRPLVRALQQLLDRAPLIKTIYNAISDLLSAFVGKKRKFNQPVLVKMIEGSNVEKLGFITSTDLSKLGIEGDRVAVYLPHSFAFSGNLFIVPARSVTPLDASAADVMKFIVSGGASDVDNEGEGAE